jgi:hypothetical protein
MRIGLQAGRAIPAVTLLLAVTASMAGCGSVGPATSSPSGTHLELDGRPLAITYSCVQTQARICYSELRGPPANSVVCDPVAPGVDRGILVTVVPPQEEFEIEADRVIWLRAKSDTPIAMGGVRTFDASRGAEVDVTIHDSLSGDTRRLAGTVRCR